MYLKQCSQAAQWANMAYMESATTMRTTNEAKIRCNLVLPPLSFIPLFTSDPRALYALLKILIAQCEVIKLMHTELTTCTTSRAIMDTPIRPQQKIKARLAFLVGKMSPKPASSAEIQHGHAPIVVNVTNIQ